ncbi:hypothetical protein, partial [Enterococcus casseliflavus]|uniref:hypothetical protein n=1 Tax=Enterococcus casseliflavus TaxID=37734 RepID=UPI0022E0ED1C
MGKTDQVTLYKRKGKIYSIIDHIIMGAAILFETYHSSPIRPIIRGRSDIRGIGLSAVSAMVFLLAWETTLSLNRHELVPVGFFILIFTADPLIGLLSRTIPIEKITYHLERLYFLHFFMMFYI